MGQRGNLRYGRQRAGVAEQRCLLQGALQRRHGWACQRPGWLSVDSWHDYDGRCRGRNTVGGVLPTWRVHTRYPRVHARTEINLATLIERIRSVGKSYAADPMVRAEQYYRQKE